MLKVARLFAIKCDGATGASESVATRYEHFHFKSLVGSAFDGGLRMGPGFQTQLFLIPGGHEPSSGNSGITHRRHYELFKFHLSSYELNLHKNHTPGDPIPWTLPPGHKYRLPTEKRGGVGEILPLWLFSFRQMGCPFFRSPHSTRASMAATLSWLRPPRALNVRERTEIAFRVLGCKKPTFACGAYFSH